MNDELKKQVGGDHYRRMVMQPIEYAVVCRLDFLRGSVVKYLSRHQHKNGMEDLDKAAHLCMIGMDMGAKYADVDAAMLAATDLYCRLNEIDAVTEDAIVAVLYGDWRMAVELIGNVRRLYYGE